MSMLSSQQVIIIQLIAGILACLLGFKLFNLFQRIIGFVIMFFVGYLIFASINLPLIASIIIALIFGVLGAIIAGKLYRLIAALYLFSNAFIITFAVFLISKITEILKELISAIMTMDYEDFFAYIVDNFSNALMIAGIIGLVFAILGFIFAKGLIIISSSFKGASSISTAICSLASLSNPVITVVMVIAFTTLGIFVQIKTNGGFLDKKKETVASSVPTQNVMPEAKATAVPNETSTSIENTNNSNN